MMEVLVIVGNLAKELGHIPVGQVLEVFQLLIHDPTMLERTQQS